MSQPYLEAYSQNSSYQWMRVPPFLTEERSKTGAFQHFSIFDIPRPFSKSLHLFPLHPGDHCHASPFPMAKLGQIIGRGTARA